MFQLSIQHSDSIFFILYKFKNLNHYKIYNILILNKQKKLIKFENFDDFIIPILLNSLF